MSQVSLEPGPRGNHCTYINRRWDHPVCRPRVFGRPFSVDRNVGTVERTGSIRVVKKINIVLETPDLCDDNVIIYTDVYYCVLTWGGMPIIKRIYGSIYIADDPLVPTCALRCIVHWQQCEMQSKCRYNGWRWEMCFCFFWRIRSCWWEKAGFWKKRRWKKTAFRDGMVSIWMSSIT